MREALIESAPSVFILSEHGVWAIFSSMLDQQKISVGRVRQAYDLTANEVEQLIQSLWPDAVFPVELWNRTHETFWRAFADARQAVYKMESPTLPQVDLSLKRFQTYLLAHDIMDFFRRLSLNIHVNALKPGLTSILEESYEDMESIFSKEREFLFTSLDRLNTENIFEQYSPDSALFEKPVCSIPVSSYHFIAHIFVDTIMLDRDSAIRHLRHYPLRREVKGIPAPLWNPFYGQLRRNRLLLIKRRYFPHVNGRHRMENSFFTFLAPSGKEDPTRLSVTP